MTPKQTLIQALKTKQARVAILGLGYVGLVAVLPDDVPGWLQAAVWTLRNLYVWIMLLAILGWSHALLNRPFKWLAWANEAVYPWYMLHQSLIVLAAYWLVDRKLGAITEAAMVLLITIAGCWLIFAVVRRLGFLRPLFGMKPLPTGSAVSRFSLRGEQESF